MQCIYSFVGVAISVHKAMQIHCEISSLLCSNTTWTESISSLPMHPLAQPILLHLIYPWPLLLQVLHYTHYNFFAKKF